MELDLKYIVVGTGRCGTVYMARVLTELGFPCGHETIFNERGIFLQSKDWDLSKISQETTGNWLEDKTKIVADSSYMAVPHMYNFPNSKIIHVIRDPIKVIRSFFYGMNYFCSSKASNPWEEYIYKYLPELKKDMTQIERCCLYYVLWNEMIFKKDLLVKLEDGEDSILKFFNSNKKLAVSSKTNTFTLENGFRKELYVEHIPNGEIKQRLLEYAQRIGYNLEIKLF